MGFTRVQSFNPAESLGSSTFTVTIAATGAGNLLVIGFVNYSNDTSSVVANPGGVVMTRANSVFGSLYTFSSYYLLNTPSGLTSIVITFSPGAPNSVAAGAEYSGAATTAALDQQNVTILTGASTFAGNTVTTTTAGELLFGFFAQNQVCTALTNDAPWTQIGSNGIAEDGEQLNVAIGTYKYSGTLTGCTPTGDMGVIIDTFKPPSVLSKHRSRFRGQGTKMQIRKPNENEVSGGT